MRCTSDMLVGIRVFWLAKERRIEEQGILGNVLLTNQLSRIEISFPRIHYVGYENIKETSKYEGISFLNNNVFEGLTFKKKKGKKRPPPLIKDIHFFLVFLLHSLIGSYLDFAGRIWEGFFMLLWPRCFSGVAGSLGWDKNRSTRITGRNLPPHGLQAEPIIRRICEVSTGRKRHPPSNLYPQKQREKTDRKWICISDLRAESLWRNWPWIKAKSIFPYSRSTKHTVARQLIFNTGHLENRRTIVMNYHKIYFNN